MMRTQSTCPSYRLIRIPWKEVYERRVTNAANFSDTVSNCPISDGEEVKRKTFLTATNARALARPQNSLPFLSAHSSNAQAQKGKLGVLLWKWAKWGGKNGFTLRGQSSENKITHTEPEIKVCKK